MAAHNRTAQSLDLSFIGAFCNTDWHWSMVFERFSEGAYPFLPDPEPPYVSAILQMPVAFLGPIIC